MMLTLSLPPEAERRLRERAREAGQEIAEFVRQLIDRELAAPSSLAEAAELP
jgi:predicted DNA-binding protein